MTTSTTVPFSVTERALIQNAQAQLATMTRLYFPKGLADPYFGSGCFAIQQAGCKGPALESLARYGSSPNARALTISKIFFASSVVVSQATAIVKACRGSQILVLNGTTPFAIFGSSLVAFRVTA